MKRNWYALVILLLLALCLTGGGIYLRRTTQRLYLGVQRAYACTEWQDYEGARQAYHTVNSQMRQDYTALSLLVRRNLLDLLEQTLATLPAYANPDNAADLAVESARACAQLRQIEQAYFYLF